MPRLPCRQMLVPEEVPALAVAAAMMAEVLGFCASDCFCKRALSAACCAAACLVALAPCEPV